MLDNRVKELIAIGASVTANCQPCLDYHIYVAKKNDAQEEEIKEAIEIGKTVRKGAAAKMDKFILDIGRRAASCECAISEDSDCKC